MCEFDISIPSPKAFNKDVNEFNHFRLNKAYDEVINEITKDVSTKIKTAIEAGDKRVILYTFCFNNFSELKDAEFDKNGIKIRFGDNIALHRILGHNDFYQKLSNYLNSSLESTSYYSFSKRNKNDGTWNIYAYWGNRPQDNIQDINDFNSACDEVITKITKEANAKIKAAVNEGKYSTTLYTFYVSDDTKGDEFDKNGNQVRFGNNIFLGNMISKRPWKFTFFKKLQRNFNISVNRPIRSKWYTIRYFFDKETSSFNIYASWKRQSAHF